MGYKKRDYESDADKVAALLQENPGKYVARKEICKAFGLAETSSSLNKILDRAREKYSQIRKNPSASVGGFCWFGTIPGSQAGEAKEEKAPAVKSGTAGVKKGPGSPAEEDAERCKARKNASGAPDPTAYKALGYGRPMCGEVWETRGRNGSSGPELLLVMNIYENEYSPTYVCLKLQATPVQGNAKGKFSVTFSDKGRPVKYYGNANIPLLKSGGGLNARTAELSIEEFTKARSAMAEAFRIRVERVEVPVEKVVEKEVVVEKTVEKEVPALDEETKNYIKLLEYKVQFLEGLLKLFAGGKKDEQK